MVQCVCHSHVGPPKNEPCRTSARSRQQSRKRTATSWSWAESALRSFAPRPGVSQRLQLRSLAGVEPSRPIACNGAGTGDLVEGRGEGGPQGPRKRSGVPPWRSALEANVGLSHRLRCSSSDIEPLGMRWRRQGALLSGQPRTQDRAQINAADARPSVISAATLVLIGQTKSRTARPGPGSLRRHAATVTASRAPLPGARSTVQPTLSRQSIARSASV